MKTIKYTLALILFFNTAVGTAGPREEAQKAIGQSQKAAKDIANKLLQRDLRELIAEVLKSSANTLPEKGMNLPQQLQALNARVVEQLDKNISAADLDLKQVAALAESYRGLVRERFKASFDVQDLIYQRDLTLRYLEMPFVGFASLCRAGRSEKGAIGDPTTIPSLPGVQYSFSINYGSNLTGYSGMEPASNGGVSNISFNDNSPGPAAQDRRALGSIINTVAGVDLAVASGMTEASAAAVKSAAAAGPYVLAAVVAYAVLTYALSQQEQSDRETELTQAQLDMFKGAATDRDIVGYYKDSCQVSLKKLQPLRKMIRDFYTSDEAREKIRGDIASTAAARNKFYQDARVLEPMQKVSVLGQHIEAGTCDNVKNADFCKKKEGGYILTQFPAVKLDLKAPADKELYESAKAQLDKFDETYPQALVVQYQAYKVLETVYENWSTLSQVIANSSFESLDQDMNLLSLKLQLYVAQVQKAKNSSWSRSGKLLGAETKLQTEFFSLREEFFSLLTEALKIFFSKSSAQGGKKHFADFKKRFDRFAGKTLINPDVRSMNESVTKLGQFYDEL